MKDLGKNVCSNEMPGVDRTPLIDLYRYYAQYLRTSAASLGLSAVFLVLSTFTYLARPWPLKIIVDDVILDKSSKRSAGRGVPALSVWLAAFDRSTLLWIACTGVIVIAVLYGIFDYYHNLLVAQAGQKAVFQIRAKLHAHVQRLSLSFHGRSKSGDLMSRLIRDVNQIRDFLTDSAVELAGEAVFLVGMVAIMVVLDWHLTLLLFLSVAPVTLYAVTRCSSQLRNVTQKRLESESQVATIFSETLSRIAVVQLFSSSRRSSGFEEQNRSNYKAEMKMLRSKNKMVRSVEIGTAVGTGLVFWFGARQVLERNMSPGDLIVFVSYLRTLFKPVRRVATLIAQTSRVRVSAERIMQLLKTEPEIRDAPDAIVAPGFRGHVEFVGVSFGYEPGWLALRDISFKVHAGQTVAVTGLSGSGKSTLTSLIPRLYDPATGAVSIDGEDVRRYQLSSLRNQIAVVPQSPMLFGSTIIENITYGADSFDREAVHRATRLAHADEFIDKLPKGYETVLGERGKGLSAGQRQRIAIARALWRDAPIVILDEPTTGLDAVAEGYVLAAIENLLRNRTAFVITHRPSTMRKADLILVLEAGTLVEFGTFDQLFRAKTRLRQLCELQLSHAGIDKNTMDLQWTGSL